mmetsp:Transcript_26569/g.37429  ORF Transcript_26569/g.37429 Transcript_26569/m.37429 type:complete len:88 (-) Transcript_26569:250-513(-)
MSKEIPTTQPLALMSMMRIPSSDPVRTSNFLGGTRHHHVSSLERKARLKSYLQQALELTSDVGVEDSIVSTNTPVYNGTSNQDKPKQ